MSDQLWAQVVTTLSALISALIGAITGYFVSEKHSARAFDRQRLLDEQRRSWELEDKRRSYRLVVKERRCDQAEQFVVGMTEDFHQFLTQSILLLRSLVAEDVHERIQPYGYWQEYIDKRLFSYGPVIRGLGGGEDGLLGAWN